MCLGDYRWVSNKANGCILIRTEGCVLGQTAVSLSKANGCVCIGQWGVYLSKLDGCGINRTDRYVMKSYVSKKPYGYVLKKTDWWLKEDRGVCVGEDNRVCLE